MRVAEPCATVPRFYLGTHMPNWLEFAEVPLFVSARRLRPRVQLPYAVGPWALDSGGFTELQQYGSWAHGPTPSEYAAEVRRYQRRIGRLEWAAPQDWMCEPLVINGGTAGVHRFAGTGLTVAEHQARTVDNYLELTAIAPDLPWIPVIQGWTVDDYLRCVERYQRNGVNLAALPLVGVGSVCRRQATTEAAAIFGALHDAGVRRLHGFGVKTLGLARSGGLLTSCDSLAWSLDARRKPPLNGCIGHRNCANCPRYALQWRTKLLATTGGAAC